MRDHEIVVTGGSGGLGRWVTKELVDRGARVTVPVFDPSEERALEACLGAGMARVRCVAADLRDEASAAALVGGVDRLHALVHLVGGFSMGPLHEISLDAYHRLVDLNLTTTVVVLKHALARMREHGYGRIVTVSARAALQPPGEMAVYAAVKAAVLALTQAVAEETKGTDITANAVLPSVIDTAANRAAMGDAEAERWVTPQSLAETIAFLASAAAGDLRGSALRAYGRL